MANAICIAKRANIDQKKLDEIDDEHIVWDNVAHYLAHLCHSLMSIVSCDAIVVGGGVFKRKIILPKIQKKFVQLNNDYVKVPQVSADNVGKYICYSVYGDNAGIVGALHLAKIAK